MDILKVLIIFLFPRLLIGKLVSRTWHKPKFCNFPISSNILIQDMNSNLKLGKSKWNGIQLESRRCKRNILILFFNSFYPFDIIAFLYMSHSFNKRNVLFLFDLVKVSQPRKVENLWYIVNVCLDMIDTKLLSGRS